MMKHWRLWLGVAMLMIGFGLREHAHALAAQDWVSETARRLASNHPEEPPACVFDCSYKLSGDAETLGWIAIGMMALGLALLVSSSMRRDRA
ncbi:MAG: hypothetical protein ACXWJC_03710 [Croceibacterium sp.]